MTAADLRYRIIVSASGDVAEADTLDAALLAASTLVADHVAATPGTDSKSVRRSVYITRDGRYDGGATMSARA